MAENYEDPAGSTQMFRAFVETPAAQAPSNVSVHRSGGGNSRTGLIAAGAVVALLVVVAVVWLAVK
ncbi:hypothetical protein OG455_20850 [Kitasatospora sp. NBC_01287]|uniref:hypothetical protein n=1 Tax=Kitasatospora sp. NBC_01287 TaxID=2903573 RepID=UPI00225A0F61|nr:hypothetical protein [Kitasatospora sp. NBC_01287]MCX4747934.1 hypothetical protein [Kitasatospora sp. NBC_01287]